MKQSNTAKLQAELARRELAKRRYSEYLAYVHGRMWKRTRLSSHLADRAQAFVETETGHAYDILVIETPPQHGKSMTITETFPSWYLGKYPGHRVIEASYNDTFAKKFCRRNKAKIKEFCGNLFDIQLGDVDTAEEFELSSACGGGGMISRGMRAGITGNPANLVIIDDPIKNREEADSPTIRDKLWEEWQNSIKSRLAAGAKIIVIMTPWHEDDLAARILRSEPNTTLLRIPVEAEADDPLGRDPGDALCPELGKDKEWLEDFRRSYINDPQGGIRAWQALYQCSPRVEEGNLIKREWWEYYDPKEAPTFGTQIISVDAAFKGTDTSDFVAITVWGKRDLDCYCQYCLNRQMTFTETLAQLRLIRRLYPAATRVLIEDKANGAAITDVLSREMFILPIQPRGGKESRVNAISAAIEAGHVHLPNNQPWIVPFVDQFAKFPNDVHDDMVDSTSQALIYMLFMSGTVAEPQPERERRIMEAQQREQDAFLDNDFMYDPYHRDDGFTSSDRVL